MQELAVASVGGACPGGRPCAAATRPRSGALRRIIGAALLALVTGLAGCSAVQLGYRQADTLLWWWLDGYLDFDRQQAPAVRQAIQDWLTWHRQTQLPLYAAGAGQASAEVRQPVSAEQACAWLGQAQAWGHTALDAALPALARQAQTLTPAQRSHLARKFESRARTFDEEQVQAGEEERRRERLKGWRQRYSDLYGRLNPARDQLLAEAATTLASDPVLRLADLRRRQQAVLALLTSLSSQPPGDDRAQAELAALLQPMMTLGATGSTAWRSLQARLREGHCELFARMHQASTPPQRDHAAQWLRGWEADLRQLAGER